MASFAEFLTIEIDSRNIKKKLPRVTLSRIKFEIFHLYILTRVNFIGASSFCNIKFRVGS